MPSPLKREPRVSVTVRVRPDVLEYLDRCCVAANQTRGQFLESTLERHRAIAGPHRDHALA